MNTGCLMKFTLNFDLNAEVNWQKAKPRTTTTSSSDHARNDELAKRTVQVE